MLDASHPSGTRLTLCPPRATAPIAPVDKELQAIEESKPKILAALKKAPEPLSTRGVLDRVRGRKTVTTAALAALVDSGQVIESRAGTAKLHSLPDTEGE